MIKLVFIGVWACLMTLASGYAMGYARTRYATASTDKYSVDVALKKTDEFNVPEIRDGAVKGYVVAQFGYIVNTAAMSKLPVPPDVYVVDEAYRYIYDDESNDGGKFQKLDLQNLSKTVKDDVNKRLKSNVILDVTIQELTYLSSAQALKPL